VDDEHPRGGVAAEIVEESGDGSFLGSSVDDEVARIRSGWRSWRRHR
jgi:hypothetical protein